MRKKPITDYRERWERINAAKDRAGFRTQKELGKALDVSQATISGWKNGDFLPSLDTMQKLAQLSGYCVEYLMIGRGPKFPQQGDPRHQQLLDILGEMSDQELDELEGLSRDDLAEALDLLIWRKRRDRARNE